MDLLLQGPSAIIRPPAQAPVLRDCVTSLPRQFSRTRTLKLPRGVPVGREDLSLRMSKLEQENLKEFRCEGGAMRSHRPSPKGLKGTTTLHDGDGYLVEYSDALQMVAKALREMAESKALAQDEAAKWKRKYEVECRQNAQLKQLADDNTGLDSMRVEEPSTLHNPETDAGEPRDAGELNGKPPIPRNRSCHPKEGICDEQVLRHNANSFSNMNPDTLVDERVSADKALFTLAWGSTGEKNEKHNHGVVSFEAGDITMAVRSNKQITLVWDTPPQSVFILSKPNAATVQQLCKEMVRWLREEKGSRVYVEPTVKAELVKESLYFEFLQTCETDEEVLDLHNKVDLVITLGGDGTVLWAASIFKGPMPPLVSFSMGSLGFMTQFQSDCYREGLQTVMKGPVYITLRHRLHCQITRNAEHMEDGASSSEPEEHLVLNEVSIDRGMSSSLSNLECYCDGHFVTVVQGDGLILSTPSGSTAYSLAAGGSMVHPQVPGILFTPICPHSLSFRPLILPEYVTLRVQLPMNCRGQAWASFDGKARQQLSGGDALIVRMSAWPVPAACQKESSGDFLRSVREGLHWNLRKTQLSDGPQQCNSN